MFLFFRKKKLFVHFLKYYFKWFFTCSWYEVWVHQRNLVQVEEVHYKIRQGALLVRAILKIYRWMIWKRVNLHITIHLLALDPHRKFSQNIIFVLKNLQVVCAFLYLLFNLPSHECVIQHRLVILIYSRWRFGFLTLLDRC